VTGPHRRSRSGVETAVANVDQRARTLSREDEKRAVVVISAEHKARWIDLRETAAYRDLLYYLVRRDIVIRYLQTILGPAWAIIQPIASMVVFSIFFGRVAHISSHGVPYPLFSLTALVPWTYFANAVGLSSASVLNNSSVISKVYFPRIFIPLSPILASLVDFAVALAVLAAVMAGYGHSPSASIVFLPILIALALATAAATGIWLAALSSRYRDVRFATPFMLQLLLFASPVIFDVSAIPHRLQYVYALNPMVGVIDGFRAALLGTTAFPWALVGIGTAVTAALLYTAGRYFKRTELFFSDLA
jgi:lipopolysaccharide transport system permease protein